VPPAGRDTRVVVSDTTRTANPSASLTAAIGELVLIPPGSHLKTLLSSADEWVVSIAIAHVLEGLVLHMRPASVHEFGAGRSSLVLAQALQTIGGGRLTSIEHQPQFAEAAWRQMTLYRTVDAQLIPAGLSLRASRHGLLHAYTGAGEALSGRGPFGMVFIDAPPGHLGRDATLLAAAPFLAPGAIAVLDDAARPGEKTAVRRWERALDVERVYESDTVGRGLIVLRVAQPQSPAFSWRTFAGTIHDRVIERPGAASG
jgi:predicted O-methyltransferase YrrM